MNAITRNIIHFIRLARLTAPNLSPTRRLSVLLAALLFGLALGLSPARAATIFVSDFNGHRVLKVEESGEGVLTTVVFNGTTNGYPDALPEGIAMGSDGYVYICDSIRGRIFRVLPDGKNFVQLVYNRATATPPNNPSGPEGPSFSTAGDLYFNTRGGGESSPASGVWKISANQLTMIPEGGATPVNVLPTFSSFGEGTAFDASDNLLAVDGAGNRVLSSAPPYTSSSPLISSGLTIPIGVAVDGNGDIFVANASSDPPAILRFDSGGTPKDTYASFTPPDSPRFMMFDAKDNLYVASEGQRGKLWKVPTGGGTPLLLYSATGEGVTAFAGVAIAPTSNTITQPLDPNGGTNIYTYGAYNFKTTYPPDPQYAGLDLAVTARQITRAEFKQIVAGSQFADSDCIIYGGANGYCVLLSAVCINHLTGLPVPCPNSPPGTTYKVLTSYNSQIVQRNPGFLRREGPSIQDLLVNFFQNRIDPTDEADPVSWSDWIAVEKAASPFSSFTVRPVAVSLGQNGFATAGVFSTASPLTLPQNVLFRFGGVTVFVSAASLKPTGTGGFFFIGKPPDQDIWVAMVLQPIGTNRFAFAVAERGAPLALTGVETSAPFQLTVGANSATASAPVFFVDQLDF